MSLKEFVADFIRDDDGVWWFINVKAFIIDKYENNINIKIITMNGESGCDKPVPEK